MARLNTTHPDLAKQWHPLNDKDSSEVTPGSKYRARWVCPVDGYEWESSVQNRTLNGSGCPVCANRVIIAGINDLASLRPDIAAEWHPDNDKKATEVAVGAGYRAKWRCLNGGHEWHVKVCNRTIVEGSGCPVCAGKAVQEGVNDLAFTHPDLTKEWWKGNKLKATEVSAGSKKKVTWECSSGHRWDATVQSRALQGVGCGKCSGRHVDAGVNDLATLYPELVAEWGSGNPFGPETYRPGSNYVAQWECSTDPRHVWDTAIANRVYQDTGCPVCGNRKAVAGINDMTTTHPAVAAQWSPRNTLTASQVTSGTCDKAWWVCAKGHEWDAAPVTRCRMNTGCPYCSGRLAIVGETDIATTHPHLVKEWSPDDDKTPQDVSSGSDYRAKWVCSKGHKWESQVKHRALGGQGCPTCVSRQFSSKGEKELQDFIAAELVGTYVVFNDRQVQGVSELDVHIPSMKLAFEFDGLYWHSEATGKGPTYHSSKQEACRAAGITLIGIWEDDWRDRKDVVKNMVRRKLGVSSAPKLNARDMIVDARVPRLEADVFLSANHIQGSVNGSVFTGLRDKDGVLVAVMSALSRRGAMEIARYATSANVRGGFGKLLKGITSEARRQGLSKIITYSDNTISDGALYRNAGFTAAENIPPKYWVTWKLNRVHSSTLKRKKFRDDPTLKYDPAASLVDNYRLNNMHRIWDYGKVRWELEL